MTETISDLPDFDPVSLSAFRIFFRSVFVNPDDSTDVHIVVGSVFLGNECILPEAELESDEMAIGLIASRQVLERLTKWRDQYEHMFMDIQFTKSNSSPSTPWKEYINICKDIELKAPITLAQRIPKTKIPSIAISETIRLLDKEISYYRNLILLFKS